MEVVEVYMAVLQFPISTEHLITRGVSDDLAAQTRPSRNTNGEPSFFFWRLTVRVLSE